MLEWKISKQKKEKLIFAAVGVPRAHLGTDGPIRHAHGGSSPFTRPFKARAGLFKCIEHVQSTSILRTPHNWWTRSALGTHLVLAQAAQVQRPALPQHQSAGSDQLRLKLNFYCTKRFLHVPNVYDTGRGPGMISEDGLRYLTLK